MAVGRKLVLRIPMASVLMIACVIAWRGDARRSSLGPR